MKKISIIILTILAIIGALYFITKKTMSSDEYWARGVIFEAHKLPDEAIKMYEEGLKVYPKDSRLTCAIGFSYEDKYFADTKNGSDYLTQAINYYKKGLDLDQTSVYCRGYLSEAYLYAGDYLNSWAQTNILIKQGYNPPSGFINDLSRKMPNPQR